MRRARDPPSYTLEAGRGSVWEQVVPVCDLEQASEGWQTGERRLKGPGEIFQKL